MAKIVDLLQQGNRIKAPKAAELIPEAGKQWPSIEASLRDGVLGSVHFDIQNVTDYLFAGTDQEHWEIKTDFPYLTPPFEECWLETGNPPFIASNGQRKGLEGGKPDRWGAYMQSSPWQETDRKGWLVGSQMVLAWGGELTTPGVQIVMFLDEQGTLIDAPKWALLGGDNYIEHMKKRLPSFPHSLIAEMSAKMFPIWLALSFLHCKNISVAESNPNPKLAKARQRRNKPPLTKYYTLEIETMKRVLRTEGRSEEVGLKRALHICRGHFASYTEEKPLFGKIAGRFWIPAHVRGSKEAGEINKDYKVKAPK